MLEINDRLSDEELEHRARDIEELSRQLVSIIWSQVGLGIISERGPIADTTFQLRDVLNPNWPQNPDWLAAQSEDREL